MSKITKHAGFTLVEAIFFVLAIGFLMSAFLNVYLTFNKNTPKLLSETRAIDLAISCAEILKTNSQNLALCEKLTVDTPYKITTTVGLHQITVHPKKDDTILVALEYSDVETVPK